MDIRSLWSPLSSAVSGLTSGCAKGVFHGLQFLECLFDLLPSVFIELQVLLLSRWLDLNLPAHADVSLGCPLQLPSCLFLWPQPSRASTEIQSFLVPFDILINQIGKDLRDRPLFN